MLTNDLKLTRFYNLVQVYQPSRALRSSTQKLLQVPFLSTDLVSAPSATALLRHRIQFLLPLKLVPPYTVSSATSSLRPTSQPSSLTTQAYSVRPPGDCLRLRFMLNAGLCACYKFFSSYYYYVTKKHDDDDDDNTNNNGNTHILLSQHNVQNFRLVTKRCGSIPGCSTPM